jgi:hypothetical protein
VNFCATGLVEKLRVGAGYPSGLVAKLRASSSPPAYRDTMLLACAEHVAPQIN